MRLLLLLLLRYTQTLWHCIVLSPSVVVVVLHSPPVGGVAAARDDRIDTRCVGNLVEGELLPLLLLRLPLILYFRVQPSLYSRWSVAAPWRNLH